MRSFFALALALIACAPVDAQEFALDLRFGGGRGWEDVRRLQFDILRLQQDRYADRRQIEILQFQLADLLRRLQALEGRFVPYGGPDLQLRIEQRGERWGGVPPMPPAPNGAPYAGPSPYAVPYAAPDCPSCPPPASTRPAPAGPSAPPNGYQRYTSGKYTPVPFRVTESRDYPNGPSRPR